MLYVHDITLPMCCEIYAEDVENETRDKVQARSILYTTRLPTNLIPVYTISICLSSAQPREIWLKMLNV